MVASGRGWLGGRFRGTALALLASLALAACGGEDEGGTGAEDNNDTRPEATEAQPIYNASPAYGTPGRSGLAQDATTETVRIENGELDPELLEGQSGFPYILTVEGDGQPHTLTITDLVAEQQIAPQGQTQIQLNIPENTSGELDILLDGKRAGTFRIEGAGGAPDQP